VTWESQSSRLQQSPTAPSLFAVATISGVFNPRSNSLVDESSTAVRKAFEGGEAVMSWGIWW
jgi:hypothetical protein